MAIGQDKGEKYSRDPCPENPSFSSSQFPDLRRSTPSPGGENTIPQRLQKVFKH